MPDEIDEVLRSEGIFQQRETKSGDSDEKRSGPPLEDSFLEWLEECGDRQHRYAVQEIRMLRADLAQRTADLARATAEMGEALRLLKSVVDVVQESMLPTQSVPNHICDYDQRPDIGVCKVCEDFTDALAMIYPDEFKEAKP